MLLLRISDLSFIPVVLIPYIYHLKLGECPFLWRVKRGKAAGMHLSVGHEHEVGGTLQALTGRVDTPREPCLVISLASSNTQSSGGAAGRDMMASNSGLIMCSQK